jgi:hypothetical protein
VKLVLELPEAEVRRQEEALVSALSTLSGEDAGNIFLLAIQDGGKSVLRVQKDKWGSGRGGGGDGAADAAFGDVGLGGEVGAVGENRRRRVTDSMGGGSKSAGKYAWGLRSEVRNSVYCSPSSLCHPLLAPLMLYVTERDVRRATSAEMCNTPSARVRARMCACVVHAYAFACICDREGCEESNRSRDV